MRTISLILLLLLTLGCASNGDSNVRIGIGMGSYGSSGGVGVSGSTEVPVGGTKNEAPFEQVFLNQAVIDELYPAKEIPFTADKDEVKALQQHLRDDVSSADKEKLAKCRSGKARCRINLLNSN